MTGELRASMNREQITRKLVVNFFRVLFVPEKGKGMMGWMISRTIR